MKIALSVSEKEKAKGKDSPYFRALVACGVIIVHYRRRAGAIGHCYV